MLDFSKIKQNEITFPKTVPIKYESIQSNSSEEIIINSKSVSSPLKDLYLKRLSEVAIAQYGPNFLSEINKREKIGHPPQNFLDRHKLNPALRRKMVDWMLEVFNVFHSEEETFFVAVNIMDNYIWKTKKTLEDKDIKLIGIVSMFLASKSFEYIPITLEKCVNMIAHRTIEGKEIIRMEKKIFNTIQLEILNVGIYEFIHYILYDFYINNKKWIEESKTEKFLDVFENCGIYLAKMSRYYEEFVCKNSIYLGIACLIFAFDLIKDNSQDFNQESQELISSWLTFIFKGMAKGKEEQNEIQTLYQRIKKYYDYFRQKKSNLNKYHQLYFN